MALRYDKFKEDFRYGKKVFPVARFTPTGKWSSFRPLLPQYICRTNRAEMGGDAEKMIAVGLVWGATNAIMRRGALIWDHKLKAFSSRTQNSRNSQIHHRVLATIKNWVSLLLIWQYSVPFLINLSASAAFFAILSETPISLAVPVTNATTFAATAVTAMLLGEETRVGLALLGTFLIVLGVCICIA
ncbi:uncharacterized protein LOC131157084 [Malania oleifera]|uniref:uncharacterized protein LOC131157084 n=1 Tax=Malania oleifera TaxID=397392 RepID=UPI0025AE043E|nr:uncharacterized protein LOC131157084 [Malania oleifera]